MSPIRVGVIGVGTPSPSQPAASGTWGALTHLPALRESPRYKIVAIANSTVESAKTSIAFHKLDAEVKAYGSAEEMAKDPEIDPVVISVIVPKHHDLKKPLLLAKKDVFVEWPLTANTAEYEELADLAKSQNVKGIVETQARANPLVVKIKELIDSGRIATVLSFTATGSFMSVMRPKVPDPIKYLVDKDSGGNNLTIFYGHCTKGEIEITALEIMWQIATLGATLKIPGIDTSLSALYIKPAEVKDVIFEALEEPDYIASLSSAAKGVARTWEAFANGETSKYATFEDAHYPFNCSDILPYLYAGPRDSTLQQPVPVYSQTYTDPGNPFLSTYISGTCQYPQLTIGGLLDGQQHGRDLAEVFGATGKLSLFPEVPSRETTYFRSSESPLTQQSAGGVLRGIWPNHRASVPLHQQATSIDTVNAGYSCSVISFFLAKIRSTSEWQAHLAATLILRSTLRNMFSANSSAWQGTMDHFADNFQARLCNSYSLPCSPTDASNCITQEMAEVFRTADWEWTYYWRANPYAQKYIQAVEGLFIGEIVSRLESVVNGTIRRGKYSHAFIHDGDIGPVAGALGINALRWPGMGSNIAFEIWKVHNYTAKTNDAYFARVLYSGQPMKSIYGDLDWIPLQSLLGILRRSVPADIVALCNS
ncbi:hypothetical protein DID88_000745 [Monilinia fructigena]|uniref:Gfo/Idh/MocA-like oxidoreductase N-terminal domain-containing protein n=1 Tax=Monilinia fructigena TaxID=38457 RepID=A0A395IIQ2_9HELO|nr:hypothetical protein DID88_000745 [Monilinia fructigena]